MQEHTMAAGSGWEALVTPLWRVTGVLHLLDYVNGVTVIDVGGEFELLKLKILHKTINLEEEKCGYQAEKKHGVEQRFERKSRVDISVAGGWGWSCCSAESPWGENWMGKGVRNGRKSTQNPNACCRCEYVSKTWSSLCVPHVCSGCWSRLGPLMNLYLPAARVGLDYPAPSHILLLHPSSTVFINCNLFYFFLIQTGKQWQGSLSLFHSKQLSNPAFVPSLKQRMKLLADFWETGLQHQSNSAKFWSNKDFR